MSPAGEPGIISTTWQANFICLQVQEQAVMPTHYNLSKMSGSATLVISPAQTEITLEKKCSGKREHTPIHHILEARTLPDI